VSLSEKDALALWRTSQRRPWLLPEALRAALEDRALRSRLLTTREGALARNALRRVRDGRPRSIPVEPPTGAAEAHDAPAELPLQAPRPWLARYLASKPLVTSDKARDLVGYQPVFDLQHGMTLTEHWARWVGLIPERAAR
jgi:hypothetical protein